MELVESVTLITVLLIVIIAIFYLAIELFKLLIYKIIGKRVTDYFIIVKYKDKQTIYQDVGREGRQEIRMLMLNNKDCTIDTKLRNVSYFFVSKMVRLFKKLDKNTEYTTVTHLYNDKMMNSYYIKQTSKPVFIKKRLLFELITFLGMSDFLKALFNKKYRNNVYKKFYKLRFKVMQNNRK